MLWMMKMIDVATASCGNIMSATDRLNGSAVMMTSATVRVGHTRRSRMIYMKHVYNDSS